MTSRSNATNADADHKKKMKALQATQNKKRDEAVDPERGLVLVHTGNGKGKSSSAFGVIIRALGWGHRVGVVQFIKGTWVTGERQFFKKLNTLADGTDDSRIQPIDWHTMGEGFTWNTQDRARDIAAAQAAFETACTMMASGKYNLIVLDEINIALRYEYLTPDAVLAGVMARHVNTSVILTGRDAPDAICEYADLVSDMGEVKHPYHAGIKAQKGIDF